MWAFYGVNVKAEFFIEALTGVARWRQGCDVHHSHTIQGLSFAVVSDLISGVLAFGLTQRQHLALHKWRLSIVDVLLGYGAMDSNSVQSHNDATILLQSARN